MISSIRRCPSRGGNGRSIRLLSSQRGRNALTDMDGNTVARYTYDAWGKVLSVTDTDGNAICDADHIANLNPYRYRSYYYDIETQLYYLQSRYYDPAIGRFINGDEACFIDVSYNLYSYCNNLPVILLALKQFGLQKRITSVMGLSPGVIGFMGVV